MINQKEDRHIKNEFINNEVTTLTINGAFGHNPIYNEHCKGPEKEKFRIYIRNILLKYGVIYKESVEEEGHYNKLTELQGEISAVFGYLLKNQALNIGTIQKLLNLYLKYMWCLDLIPTPPHCPVDSVVLKKINRGNTKWTKMTSIDEYKKIINEIKKVSKHTCISEWELEIWNSSKTKI
ncbi:MAG: hypothetical protein PHH52_00585 [Patescibacteria group bacterium]|nr:hypothetical protein [Bacteroidales bacterium]MDD3777865.1 hypothetical protein [Patescibacteria group bacterium]